MKKRDNENNDIVKIWKIINNNEMTIMKEEIINEK